MSEDEFQRLLNRTARAAWRHRELTQQCGDAFLARYGAHYSDVDADGVIDVLNQLGGNITVAECDDEMERCGHPRREE